MYIEANQSFLFFFYSRYSWHSVLVLLYYDTEVTSCDSDV